jgi:hypothetical protein
VGVVRGNSYRLAGRQPEESSILEITTPRFALVFPWGKLQKEDKASAIEAAKA